MALSRPRTIAAVLVVGFAMFLTGCSDKNPWDEPSARAPGTAAAPAAAPAGREVIVLVTRSGSVTCRADGVSLRALTGDALSKSDPAEGRRLLIVQDLAHDRETVFAVPFDLDFPEVSVDGTVTLRHLQHNLLLEADGAAEVTLEAQEPQQDIDACVRYASEDDADRLESRLAADPGLIEGKDSKRGQTPLCRAAEAGNEDIVRLLVDRKANLEARDNAGRTPLHYAVLRGRLNIVRLLAEKGADINAATGEGDTPMHLALRTGNNEIAQFLTDRGASSDIKNQSGQSAMQIALDKIFELEDRREYGPFDDGSSIRYAARHLYVRSGKADIEAWDEYEVPVRRGVWTGVEGTHFQILVRGSGRTRVWCRYHAEPIAPDR